MKISDINDGTDFLRYSVGSLYYHIPSVVNKKPTLVLSLNHADQRATVLQDSNGNSRRVNFDTFIEDWGEHGPFRPRLIEADGVLLYVYMSDNLDRRRHGLYLPSIKVHSFNDAKWVHPVVLPFDQAGAMIFNGTRTMYRNALKRLEDGEAVGCALTDNFGMVTTSTSEDILLTFKKHVIGSIKDGRPVLNKEWLHVERTVASVYA